VREWVSNDGAVRCYWTSHRREFIGGVQYTAATGDTFALFCGRPLWWRGDRADGQRSLDPATYLDDSATRPYELDGRYAVVRVDGQTVQLQTDASGMQPIYESHRPARTLISNVPALVTPAGTHLRASSLASFLGVGWPLTGEPLSTGVERVASGELVTISRGGARSSRPVARPIAQDFLVEPDYAEAADVFVSVVEGLAEWPARPAHLGITGGRDSRLVAAALRRAGIRFSTETLAFTHDEGYPTTEDVLLGRKLASVLEAEHVVLRIDGAAPVFQALDSVVQALRLTSPGTIALNDVMSLLLEEPRGPLPIICNGVGGEIGRAFFGYPSRGSVADALIDRIVPRSPAPIVNEYGRTLLHDWMRSFVVRSVDEGVDVEDVPDAFYVHMMSMWHGTNTTNFEYGEDAVSPFMSRRFWPFMLGQSRADRQSERLHRELMRKLGHDLLVVPFGASWPLTSAPTSRSQELRRRVRRLASALRLAVGGDPLEAVQTATRHAVARQPDHEAWEVLDRNRVETLLRSSIWRMDRPSKHQLWRLATIFCGATEPR
jgi:hypothetical protein